MESYGTYVCYFIGKEFGKKKMALVNTIEMLAGIYYLILMIVGFRNIFVIFYIQKQYSIIFPLIYLFA